MIDISKRPPALATLEQMTAAYEAANKRRSKPVRFEIGFFEARDLVDLAHGSDAWRRDKGGVLVAKGKVRECLGIPVTVVCLEARIVLLASVE